MGTNTATLQLWLKARRLVALAAITLSLSAHPALAREKQATTPSGRIEMVFAYTPLADAVTQVGSRCMDRGWMISSQASNQVICEVPMGAFQSALSQLLIGNQYSTPPKTFVRFSLAQVGEHTRAQAQSWTETQMAFGQVQHHQYQDDDTYNNMLGFLGEAGAQFPIGTRFEGSAYLGVSGEAASWRNGRRDQFGYRLTLVTPGGPAARWGLAPGDVVTKVNGRTFRDVEGFTRLLDRHRIGQPLTISALRDAQDVTASGVAEGRPTITQLVRTLDLPQGATPVAYQMQVQMAGQGAATLAVAEAPTHTPQDDSAQSALERARREAEDAQQRPRALEAQAASEEPNEAVVERGANADET